MNSLAQAAGLAALQSENYLLETLARLRKTKEGLIAGLKNLSYEPVPSQTNYFLLPVGNGARFRADLLEHGILVRDCASFERYSNEMSRIIKAMMIVTMAK